MSYNLGWNLFPASAVAFNNASYISIEELKDSLNLTQYNTYEIVYVLNNSIEEGAQVTQNDWKSVNT